MPDARVAAKVRHERRKQTETRFQLIAEDLREQRTHLACADGLTSASSAQEVFRMCEFIPVFGSGFAGLRRPTTGSYLPPLTHLEQLGTPPHRLLRTHYRTHGSQVLRNHTGRGQLRSIQNEA